MLLMPGRNDHLVDADQVKEDAKYKKMSGWLKYQRCMDTWEPNL